MATGIPLFVYGSLRKGLSNNYKMASSIFAGEWRTNYTFYMIGAKSKAYPYVSNESLHDDMVPTHIYGELYFVDNNLLCSLDEMEGHPTEYNRILVSIQKGLETTNAYMYMIESDDLKEGIRKGFSKRFVSVPNGDWFKFDDSVIL